MTEIIEVAIGNGSDKRLVGDLAVSGEMNINGSVLRIAGKVLFGDFEFHNNTGNKNAGGTVAVTSPRPKEEPVENSGTLTLGKNVTFKHTKSRLTLEAVQIDGVFPSPDVNSLTAETRFIAPVIELENLQNAIDKENPRLAFYSTDFAKPRASFGILKHSRIQLSGSVSDRMPVQGFDFARFANIVSPPGDGSERVLIICDKIKAASIDNAALQANTIIITETVQGLLRAKPLEQGRKLEIFVDTLKGAIDAPDAKVHLTNLSASLPVSVKATDLHLVEPTAEEVRKLKDPEYRNNLQWEISGDIYIMGEKVIGEFGESLRSPLAATREIAVAAARNPLTPS